MGSLTFVSVEKTLDVEVVTQPEEWETGVYPDDHDDETLRGTEYRLLALPEEKGAVTFVATLEAEGFSEGDRVQVDIGTIGGYRAFEIVEPPVGEEPQTFTWTVGPAPVGRIGSSVFIAFAVHPDGSIGDQLARYEA